MSKRILLLRALEGEEVHLGADVDVLVTHAVAPVAAGIAEAAAFPPEGALLVVSSQTTLRVLAEAGEGALAARPFAAVHAVGSETKRALEEAGAKDVRAAALPGAAGLLAELPADLAGTRILWPRAADADAAAFAELARRGAQVAAPVVYDKKPRHPLDPEVLRRLGAGEYAGVGVTSLAALDVLLASLAVLPPVRWGVIGPETAKHFAARGLAYPVVPNRAKISDLIEALRG